MTDDAGISGTSLSTLAKRALAKNDIHTMTELRLLLDEHGREYIRTRMFGIGVVIAREILRFLDECWGNVRSALRKVSDFLALQHILNYVFRSE